MGKMLRKLRDNKKANSAKSTPTPHEKPKVVILGTFITKNLNPVVFRHYATVQRITVITIQEAKGKIVNLTRVSAVLST